MTEHTRQGGIEQQWGDTHTKRNSEGGRNGDMAEGGGGEYGWIKGRSMSGFKDGGDYGYDSLNRWVFNCFLNE